MRATSTRRLSALAILVLASSARTARAFPTYSAVATGCHENITESALRATRDVRPAAAPLPTVTRDDRAFIDDLPFPVDADMKDLGAVALLNGVRFNDLHGNAPNEVDELATIHGNRTTQHEHCLRAPSDDEPNGSQSALRTCRAFVKEKIADALDGLDADGVPDVANRVELAVDLELRGKVDVPVPRFYARMGEALHAVQDGFTHMFRRGDRTKVSVVLDYVQVVEGTHVDERDGPAHSLELDKCDGDDELRKQNVQLAVQATFDVLTVVLDQTKNKQQKLAEVDVVLDRYFTYEPGCTAANAWCNAPENALADKGGCGCAVIGDGAGAGGMLAGIAGAIALTAAIARRRRRRVATLGSTIIAAAAIAALPSVARAQDESPPPNDAAPAPPAAPAPAPQPTEDEEKDAAREKEHQTPLGLYAAGAGSISNPAVAGMAGLRFRLGDRWVIGADGEWNGWIGLNSGRVRTGSLNIYGTLIARFPLRFEAVNLRSALQVGTAIQVVDLYGVPSGTTGIFAGLNPLGVEWKISGKLFVIFYPLGVALPITQLTGAPYAYPQYRSTLGLELSL